MGNCSCFVGKPVSFTDSSSARLIFTYPQMPSSVVSELKVAHQSGFSFPSMKQPGVFPLPPGWDASPLQGYPFIHLCGVRYCESKVSCQRQPVPSQGSNWNHSIWSRVHNITMGPP